MAVSVGLSGHHHTAGGLTLVPRCRAATSGEDQMKRRDPEEWFWIGVMIVALAVMVGLTIAPYVSL